MLFPWGAIRRIVSLVTGPRFIAASPSPLAPQRPPSRKAAEYGAGA